MSHTPGPWINRGCDTIEGGDGFTVARNYSDRNAERDTAEHEANARLIAAAPDLFDALRSIIQRHDKGWHYTDGDRCEDCGTDAGNCPDTCRFEQARVAIAKAEGR